jgi:hypothetical protein
VVVEVIIIIIIIIVMVVVALVVVVVVVVVLMMVVEIKNEASRVETTTLVCLSVRLIVSVAQYQRKNHLSVFHGIPSKVLYGKLSVDHAGVSCSSALLNGKN